MSTFLVTSTVVVVAIAAAVAIAIREPDQPATLRPQRRRASERPRRRLKQAHGHQPMAAQPSPARASVASPPAAPVTFQEPAGVLTEQSAYLARPVSFWVRLRSGVMLTILLAVVGAMIAVAVAGFVLFLAVAIRDAVT